MQVNYIEKLNFKLTNTKPVELNDFLGSILAFQKEYKKDIESKGYKYDGDEFKLYINVREGSIEWEFIRIAIDNYVAPLLVSIPDILLKMTAERVFDFFHKILKDEKIEDLPKNDLKNIANILSPPSNDFNSSMTATYNSCNITQQIHIYNISGVEAKAVKDKIGELANIKDDTTDEFENEVLYWKHIVSDDRIKTGDRGIIEKYSLNPAKLIMSDELKEKMIKDDNLNPTNVYFIVNGEVKKANDKIIAYIIKELVEIIHLD